MTRQIRHIATATILLLVSASLALGASLTVSASGNGIYTVQGSDMDEIAGFDLLLNYDSAVLASPSVSPGSLVSGAMFAANPNYSKNSIKIAVVSAKTFSGSGPVATISFATHTGTGSGVTVAGFNPINSSGATVSSSASTSDTSNTSNTVNTSNRNTSSTDSHTTGGNTGATTANTTGSSGPTYLGTVTMPSDSQPQNEVKPASASETAAKRADASASTNVPAPREASASGKSSTASTKAGAGTTSYTPVLERFRVYQGTKTPAIMIALFKQQISPSFRQEPFVALSNGTTTVTIVAELPTEAGTSPNFALNGAKLVSLKKDDAAPTWFIEALPEQGALSASLMVLSEDHVTEYPLTIAPVIPNAASTEAEFAAFLKGAGKTPAQQDMNGDGKYDGIDDYIYTANYLVLQQKTKPAVK